jgi:hypothetical protein
MPHPSKPMAARAQPQRQAAKPCTGFVPSGVQVAEVRKLRQLRNKIALENAKTRGYLKDTLDAVEWVRMDSAARMVVMVFAGIDGDMQELGRKDWREFAPPEQDAIRHAVRALARATASCQSLGRI